MKHWHETEAERRARFYAEIQRLKNNDDNFYARRDLGIKLAREMDKKKTDKMPWYWGPAKFLNEDGLALVVVALIVGYFAGRLF